MTEDQMIVKVLIERYPFLAPYNVFTGGARRRLRLFIYFSS
jgi:hypothetical protein